MFTGGTIWILTHGHLFIRDLFGTPFAGSFSSFAGVGRERMKTTEVEGHAERGEWCGRGWTAARGWERVEKRIDVNPTKPMKAFETRAGSKLNPCCHVGCQMGRFPTIKPQLTVNQPIN